MCRVEARLTIGIAGGRKEFDEIAARLEELAVAFDRKAARAGSAITPDMRIGSGVAGGGGLIRAKPLRSEADLRRSPPNICFR